MADKNLIERLKDYGLTLKENVVICDRRAVDEAATALAEKDARYARLAGRMDAMAADNQRLRAECEGLRAAAKSFSIYTIEDDEDSIRLSAGGSQIACWGANSPQGIALLKLDAEFRAALSQKETGHVE